MSSAESVWHVRVSIIIVDSEWQIRVFLHAEVGVSMDAVSNKHPKLTRQRVSLQVDL